MATIQSSVPQMDVPSFVEKYVGSKAKCPLGDVIEFDNTTTNRSRGVLMTNSSKDGKTTYSIPHRRTLPKFDVPHRNVMELDADDKEELQWIEDIVSKIPLQRQQLPHPQEERRDPPVQTQEGPSSTFENVDEEDEEDVVEDIMVPLKGGSEKGGDSLFSVKKTQIHKKELLLDNMEVLTKELASLEAFDYDDNSEYLSDGDIDDDDDDDDMSEANDDDYAMAGKLLGLIPTWEQQ